MTNKKQNLSTRLSAQDGHSKTLLIFFHDITCHKPLIRGNIKLLEQKKQRSRIPCRI